MLNFTMAGSSGKGVSKKAGGSSAQRGAQHALCNAPRYAHNLLGFLTVH
jgi:hypothetical protein